MFPDVIVPISTVFRIYMLYYTIIYYNLLYFKILNYTILYKKLYIPLKLLRTTSISIFPWLICFFHITNWIFLDHKYYIYFTVTYCIYLIEIIIWILCISMRNSRNMKLLSANNLQLHLKKHLSTHCANNLILRSIDISQKHTEYIIKNILYIYIIEII